MSSSPKAVQNPSFPGAGSDSSPTNGGSSAPVANKASSAELSQATTGSADRHILSGDPRTRRNRIEAQSIQARRLLWLVKKHPKMDPRKRWALAFGDVPNPETGL